MNRFYRLLAPAVTYSAVGTALLFIAPLPAFRLYGGLATAGLYALENVAHADRLPEAGALLIALPLKIKGGTGGPVRLVGVLP